MSAKNHPGITQCDPAPFAPQLKGSGVTCAPGGSTLRAAGGLEPTIAASLRSSPLTTIAPWSNGSRNCRVARVAGGWCG